MKNFLTLIIGIARPFIPLAGNQAHGLMERAITLPKSQRMKLYAGMSAGDIAHAEDLHSKMTDSVSDFAVFVASRGEIEED